MSDENQFYNGFREAPSILRNVRCISLPHYHVHCFVFLLLSAAVNRRLKRWVCLECTAVELCSLKWILSFTCFSLCVEPPRLALRLRLLCCVLCDTHSNKISRLV